MLAELAKPIALILCILALYGVFFAAFLALSGDLQQRMWNSLQLLSLAGGISLISGLIFREPAWARSVEHARLSHTLPVQVFCWASGIMVLLFLISWYLESHCVFYRTIHY